MKNLLVLSSLALALCQATTIFAASPYVTKTAAGSTSCEVHFPASAGDQIRLVGTIATSDKAGSVLSVRTGTTAFQIGYTNATGTNIYLVRTNGLAPDDVVVIQRQDGTSTSGIIYGFGSTTNVQLKATTGSPCRAGDSLYLMSAAASIPVGNATVSYQGEAVYVANRGRPLRVVLDGTSACSLTAVTAKYD